MTLHDGALVPNKHHHTDTNHGNWDILSHVLFSLARSLPIYLLTAPLIPSTPFPFHTRLLIPKSGPTRLMSQDRLSLSTVFH